MQLCQPILNGILLTTANKDDAHLLSQRRKIRQKNVLAINPVCQRVRTRAEGEEERFLVPINHYKTPVHRFEEYYACRLFAQTEIASLVSHGYELLSIAGASYTGIANIFLIKYALIAGIANICGFYPDLLAVLDNIRLNERKLILYFYHG